MKIQNSYQSIKDLHLAVNGDIYAFAILQYLIQGMPCEEFHPSIQTLRLNMMSQDKVSRTLKTLVAKQFIIRDSGKSKHDGNVYTVLVDNIQDYIQEAKTGKHKKTPQQLKGIARSMTDKYTDTVIDHLANKHGKTILSSGGVIDAQPFKVNKKDGNK